MGLGIRNIIKNFPSYIKGGGGIVKVELNYSQSPLLDGKNVVITGGSSGIGFATAKKCLMSGANVVITGRNRKKLDDAVEKLRKFGNVYSVQQDVTDIESMNSKIQEMLSCLNGRVDCLVNNAGIAINHNYYDVSLADYDQIFNTCLKGPYFLTREIYKKMVADNVKGSIVMVSSNGAIIGHTIPYGIAKAGINNYCEGLAKDGINHGIRCNAVMPTYTTTSIMDEFKEIDVNGNMYKPYIKGNRWHRPEEIAELIAFLLSDNSNCVTGQLIACDSGNTVR